MTEVFTILRILLGLIVVFIIPGLPFTYLIWEKGTLDSIARFSYTLLFSMLFLPLILLYLNLLFGLKSFLFVILMTIFLMFFLPIVVVLIRKKLHYHQTNKKGKHVKNK